MFNSLKEISEYISENEIKMIDLKFCDLFGRWHHITLPVKMIEKGLFENGVAFDGSSIPGFKSLESGDMLMIPDLSTGFHDVFCSIPTVSFLCNTVEADSKKDFYRDPRNIAKKAEEFLKSTGIADDSKWGPEFEYYIFDNVKFKNDRFKTGYQIDSIEANLSDDIEEFAGIPNRRTGGYHAIPPMDQINDIRSETVDILENMGISVNYHHHEVGGPGQSETEILLASLKKAADYGMIIKYVIKMIAYENNMIATFMPKPIFEEAGNGMHFHQHLFKNGKPLFYDKNGYAGLSKLAHNYIAGILKHGPALLALTNPSTNSYRRLVPGYEAPVNLFFSLANRSAAIRVPKYCTEPDQKRIEFRPPDATCNMYVAMSAMLLAGIDGIKNNMDPGELGFGPYDVNIFKLSERERKKIKPLPASLGEALDALQKDQEFLLQGDVFTEDIIETWIECKYNEFSDIRSRPHPYEFELYLDM